MGGDFAPKVPIQGALQSLLDPSSKDIELILIGDEAQILKELKSQGASLPSQATILHSTEVVTMEDAATAVIRKKKDSSIAVGLKWVADKKADAFISAGNSGAVMAGALMMLGRISQVERPAIVIKLPTAEGFVTILDVGANVDCKASHLFYFAHMGHVYATALEGIKNPRIGLLSNGTEHHKGNELTRETDALLRNQDKLNYVGYVEGNDIFRDTADVVVCDGFVGNVLLKSAEGLAETAFKWFRKEIKAQILSIIGVLFLKKILRNFKQKFDYQPYGAAPLLGINGTVFISHGGSTPKAIQYGILTAARAVREEFENKMKSHLEHHFHSPGGSTS
jgi:glycerol-3-phosphate acyltransferase PlsX